MRSKPLPERPPPARRRSTALSPALPPGPAPDLSLRTLLLGSWAGRLFLIAAALKLIVAVVRTIGEVPAFVRVLSTAATIGLIISVGYFVWRLIVLMKRRLLWRVRRKLILSYIFVGLVPVLLALVPFIVFGRRLSIGLAPRTYRFAP